MMYYIVEMWVPSIKQWVPIKKFNSDDVAYFDATERLSFEKATARAKKLTKQHGLDFRVAEKQESNG